MKLTCSSLDLQTHLSLTCRAVPSRPSHPILGNILLEAQPATQQVFLTAFNLSLGIKTRFNAQIETGGEVTIPAKLFQDIVTRLPNGEISLSAQPEAKETENSEATNTITITHNSGQYQLRGIFPEEFPQLPAIKGGHFTTATENGTGQEVIPAQISGDDLEIAFNSQYLIEGLKVIKTSDIRLLINEAHSPAILTPLGGQKLTYLLMPVQITG